MKYETTKRLEVIFACNILNHENIKNSVSALRPVFLPRAYVTEALVRQIPGLSVS